MIYKKFLGAASAAVLIVVVILILAPGAGAQGKFKTLYKFTGGKDGGGPSGLIFDRAGNLYGTAGGVFELTPNPDGNWTESVLYRFSDQTYGGVIFDQGGNLYGTTYTGGGGGCGGAGCGIVYKLAPNPDGSWTESVLYTFCSLASCDDGALPFAGLIFDALGNLYGTTGNGGAYGYGTVFKLTPNRDGTWTESVLYSFEGGHGAYPSAGLTFDQAGNLYGTTGAGGILTCSEGEGCGTVFELTPNADGSWKHKVLHRFTGKDGRGPGYWPLIFDAAGNLYGMAFEGGGSSCWEGEGCGTVFRLSPNANGGWTAKVLHRFTGGKDGAIPVGGLILDRAGNLYGTTTQGGNLIPNCSGIEGSIGCGVVFKLVPNASGGWKETVLHTFQDKPGAAPWSGVIFDAAGNLYGTTQGDAVKTFGSVFEITP